MGDMGDGERRAGSRERLVVATAFSDPTGNADDPRREINDGTPAVRPAAAAT